MKKGKFGWIAAKNNSGTLFYVCSKSWQPKNNESHDCHQKNQSNMTFDTR